MTFRIAPIAFALGLALTACGNSDDPDPVIDGEPDASNTPIVEAPSTGETITAVADATVMSVSEDGDFLTLDHDAIEEINMGAMRMGFEVADGVNITRLEEGDRIRFRIAATESDIILTDLCIPEEDGSDCLRNG